MSAEPIEAAYRELARVIAAALVGCSFVRTDPDLRVDPPSSFEPQGYEEHLVTNAALLKLSTQPVRQMLGRPVPRYAVERQVRLELAAAGPEKAVWEQALADAVTACAPIAALNPTLNGLCERLEVSTEETDDLPPDGQKAFLLFTLRLRSGDPLGRTP